jgi:hypothetical protein
MVSHNSIPHLAAHGNTNTRAGPGSFIPEYDKTVSMKLSALPGKLQKFRPLQKTFIPGESARLFAHLFSGDGYRQTFAALCTPSFNDEPTIFCRHADKKTVGSFPGSIAGLKGPFHVNKLLIC